ncbi:hypothetical protein CBR_g21229 [Chara braunii]|uniref:Uncharacterized protein n=1 Tax=Chara braunii TaxID=69332 RepID=A0A388L160_CHABU|nr:hypothetical protein CBR_g21229 [Chara braunii]|eukprot:GBG75988.1 hypothetical protein CBR_g21229 [Chara braunii]
MAASVSGAKLACRFHGGHHLNPQFHGPVGCEARYRGMTVRTAMIGGLSVCHVASVGTQAARICAEAQGQGQILGSDSSNQQRPAPQSGAASTGRQTQRMPSGSPSISPSATLPPSSTFRPLADIICDLNRKVPENLLKIKIDHGFQLKYIPWFHANRMLNFYAPGWHGDVRNITFSPDNKTVTVVYRVTIRGADGEVWRESSGTASTSDDGFGDPVQKAEGMAFRRACARFGLGLHLYHDEDKT